MSFQNEYTTLSIDGQSYTKETLLKLVEHQPSELPAWQQSLYQFIQDWLAERNYVEVHTSGSTGTPKRIRLLKERMVNSARMTGTYFHFKKGMTALLCLPCDYIAGKMMVVRAFVWGLNLQIVPPTSNPMQGIRQTIDFAAMIPMQVSNMVEQTPEQFQLLRQLIIGGGKVGSQLDQDLQSIPTLCYATYGMTETITHIAVQKLNGTNRKTAFEALEGVHLSLDERDCLCIEAPTIVEERVLTNDIVQLIDARHFEWMGRFDHVINTGGVKVFPEQIEQTLESVIKTRFFVSFLVEEKLGQQVVLIIEDKAWNEAQLNDFKSKMNTLLPKYKRPKQVFFVEQFVETLTGKVQRNATKGTIKLS